MARYENCTTCNTTIDLDLRDNWKQCADCFALYCKDCPLDICPSCKKFAGKIYDSGKFRLPRT